MGNDYEYLFAEAKRLAELERLHTLCLAWYFMRCKSNSEKYASLVAEQLEAMNPVLKEGR